MLQDVFLFSGTIFSNIQMYDENVTLKDVKRASEVQRPKLRPHIDTMRARIAEAANLTIEQVSVKATTTEHLGFEGEEKGVSATAVCLITKQ